jgi:hypothetical protein
MVDQFTTAGPGTLLYLLEPDIDLVDITPDNPVDITPPYLDCDVTWIDSYGDYAFAAGPAGYWVYDISDHTKSVFVSRIYDTCGVKPAFFYPYLYSWEDPAANPAGIDLIDFSDPANPVLHEDALVINHEITAITMNSQYLYVAWVDGITPKVSIYEYSADPMSPTWLNDFDISDLPIELGLVNPEGAHPALIVMEEHRTQAFHVEDPLNVYATGAINNQNNITSKHIAVSGLYILHTWQDNNLAYGVSVLHCSPITGLSNDSSVHYPGDGSEVTADGTTAYVAAGTEGIQVIDFTNPQAATVAGKVEAMGPSVYVHSDGDILLCATVIGLCVYDTSISLNPILVTMPAGLNAPTQAAFIDDLAVFLQDLAPYSAFTIVNNADPFHPRVTFSLPTPETLDLISLLGSVLIFGSSTEGSLAFLDSDTFPSFSSGTNKDFAACIASVALTELRCYVSLDNGLIYIFDISAFPTIVDIMPAMFPVPLSRMMVKGPYLYGADGQNLRVLSLANIDFPIQVNNIPIGHDIKELKVRNNYLYALTTDTLEVLDLSTPDAPSIVGTVTLPHAPGMQFMDLDNQYAYVADADHPVVAVNLWPPDGPQVYGDVTKPQPGFPTKGLLINNGFLYEMHDTIGLKIYDLY